MLSRRRHDGTTERDHLLAHERATGQRPDELNVPALPDGAQPLWQAFCEMSGARAPAVSGIGPIMISEIVAWQRAFRVRLTPWEIETLLDIDRAVIDAISGDAR